MSPFFFWQLESIQHHISLTKKHIDDLNETFAPYQPPPSIFVSEYEELTSKLHDFLEREERLRQRLNELSVIIANGDNGAANNVANQSEFKRSNKRH